VNILSVDHSVVSHESWWPAVSAIVTSGKICAALSVWNLVEIGAATDAGQLERRLAFLDSLEPVWLVERRDIQRQEVERFLSLKCFGSEPQPIVAVTPHLSIVDGYLSKGNPRVGITTRQFIAGIDFASLAPFKKLSPNALKTLQTVDKRLLRVNQEKLFRAWIGPSIPVRDPNDRVLTDKEKLDLLDCCWEHEREFLAACPSLAVEDALTTERIRNARRNPQESDGADLQHAVVGLAYTDAFLTRDGYQATCAIAARNSLSPLKLAEIYKSPEELAAYLAGP
jgi:hypothetical protein